MIITNLKDNFVPISGGNLLGNLTIQNKNVVRSINNSFADTSGNVSLTLNADVANSVNIACYLATIVKTGGSGNYEARSPDFGTTWFCIGNILVHDKIQVSVNTIVGRNSKICDISDTMGTRKNQVVCIRIN